MERAAVQASGRAITVELIGQHLAAKGSASKPLLGLERLLQLPFHESVAGWEKRLIENAILMAGGNKAEAARRLDVDRRLLYEKTPTVRHGCRELTTIFCRWILLSLPATTTLSAQQLKPYGGAEKSTWLMYFGDHPVSETSAFTLKLNCGVKAPDSVGNSL